MLDFIRGLVRPSLVWMGFGALTVAFLQGRVPVEIYISLVGPMVGFWYASRQQKGGGDNGTPNSHGG